MDGKAPVFEKNYKDYLVQVNELDLKAVAKKTNTEWTGQSVVVPLFGIPYEISSSGIRDSSGTEPIYSIKIVLCQYLLQYPSKHPQDDTWTSYKDFRDAAPLVNWFHVNTEMEISGKFDGKLKALETACRNIGGKNYGSELNYDLHIKFDALPQVPMLLLFNDADDEFPAQSLLLFEKRAKHYLDMECLAILGHLLAEKLKSTGT